MSKSPPLSDSALIGMIFISLFVGFVAVCMFVGFGLWLYGLGWSAVQWFVALPVVGM